MPSDTPLAAAYLALQLSIRKITDPLGDAYRTESLREGYSMLYTILKVYDDSVGMIKENIKTNPKWYNKSDSEKAAAEADAKALKAALDEFSKTIHESIEKYQGKDWTSKLKPGRKRDQHRLDEVNRAMGDFSDAVARHYNPGLYFPDSRE